MPLAVAAAATPWPTRFPTRSRSWGWSSSEHTHQTSRACRREFSGPPLLPPWPPLGHPPPLLLLPCHFFLLWMVRAATALSRAVSSPRVVSSSSVAGWTAATTVFLEFLASQMTSPNLASFLTSSWWNWMVARSLRSPGRWWRKISRYGRPAHQAAGPPPSPPRAHYKRR